MFSITVFGFFHKTYTGIEQHSSHQLVVGYLSGPPSPSFSIAAITVTTGAGPNYASK